MLSKPQYVRIGAVTAGFTTTMLTDTLAQFVDTSIGNPTSWAWDLDGDGLVDSTAQSPVFQYPANGPYDVALTVNNAFSTDTTTFGLGIAAVPIPPFGVTHSITLAFGFWFEAPTRFSITAMQVPDESNHGLQNVAAYRMANAPPAYSSSATGGLEFVSIGQPSASPVPCVLSFDAGEFIGVLGVCGDANSLHTSRTAASGPFSSSLLGQPMTLTQFLSQVSLVMSQGAAPYSGDVFGKIGRVQLTVSQCAGIPYGSGSPSSTAPALELQTTALPFVGTTAELTITNYDAQALGVIAAGFGRGNSPSPLGTVLIANVAATATLNGGALMTPGQYTFSLAVPNDPSLQGLGPINWQAASLVVPSGEFALSNGNEWWLAH